MASNEFGRKERAETVTRKAAIQKEGETEMMLGKRVLLLVALGMVLGFAQSLGAQSAERALGQTAQASKDFRVARVWVKDELVQKAPATAAPGLSEIEMFRPVPGSIFVLIEFVLSVEEATTSLVLVDSAGTRYTPVGISPFSTAEFQPFVPTGPAARVVERVEAQQFPGGKVEATRDKATRQLTIAISGKGTKFTAAWIVPQAGALRRSELKLHIGEEEPIVIDTFAYAREVSLREAASAGNGEVVARLLTESTEINAKDKDGFTALHWAARNGHKKVVELLLTEGADPNARDTFNLWTPLHWAPLRGFKDVVELLLAKGAEVNAEDRAGRTPLHSAALLGHTEVAELLLAKGGDANAKDKDGQTPLHRVAVNGSEEITQLLLAKGAQVNAIDKSGLTPLHLAAENDTNGLAELLLVKGAEVNVKANNGKTPLDLAKTDEMKALLRKYGAK